LTSEYNKYPRIKSARTAPITYPEGVIAPAGLFAADKITVSITGFLRGKITSGLIMVI
jgi:hypothetical protein